MSFADNYLKLREQRRGTTKKDTGSSTLPVSAETETGGNSFTDNYLKLRQQRSVPSVPEQQEILLPQTPRNYNTAFKRSGLSRDEYDGNVRENYAQRVAQENRKTTSGGFYSQPELGADIERYESAFITAEAALKPKQAALEKANAEAERLYSEVTEKGAQLEKLYSFAGDGSDALATAIFERSRQDYLSLVNQFETAQAAVQTAAAEYEPAWNSYVRAAEQYNAYATGQKAEYNAWRSTIRKAGDIETEIAAIDAELKTIPSDFTNFMENLGASFAATSSGLPVQRKDNSENEARRAQLEADKELLQEELDWSNYFRYADLTGAEDFAELSKYVSTANGKEPEFNAWSGMYTSTGFNDINYDIINRNEVAKSRQGVNDVSTNASFLGLDNSERGQMTDEEIAIFNYLYAQDTAKGDTEHTNAYAYIDYLTSDLNNRQRMKEQEYWASYAEESPVASSVFSVLTSPMRGLSYIGQLADIAADGEIDQNAGYNKFSYIPSTIRQEVSGNIAENGKWGKVGSFGYDIGMSMADFLFATAIAGGFSGGGAVSSGMTMTILGSGAAADTVIQAKDRGLDDGQAFALGTIAGIAEAAMEKISLDTLLKGKWEKNAIQYILKNAVAEGGEEVGTEVINTMADILIAQDQSLWQAAIEQYMADGYSESEAFGMALADKAKEIGLAGLGGFLSGGVIGTAYSPAAQMQANTYNQAGGLVRGMGDETVQELINDGLKLDKNSDAYKLAQELQEKLNTQQDIDNYDIGKLLTETAEENRRAAKENKQTEPAEAAEAETNLDEGAMLPTVENTMAEDTVEQPVQPVTQTQELRELGMLPTAEETETERLRQRAMQAATTELERTAIQYGVDRTTYERVQRISQMVSRNVAFYQAEDAGENGFYDGESGTIYVNARSQNPVAQILSHELTHSIEGTESYAGLRSLVLRRLQDTGSDLRALRKTKIESYAKHGKPLTQEGADWEIVAEYVEKNLLTDEQSIRQLVKEDRKLGTRILNWLNDILAKFGNASAQERQFLNNARRYYADALNQSSFTQETAKAAPQQTDEVMQRTMDMMQLSYGGMNANGANLESLRTAMQMQMDGVAAETIFRETGWYAGADGKWRFEIDDSRMQYHSGGDALFSQNHLEYAELQTLLQKLFNGDITDAEHERLTALDDIWGREFGRLSERVERGNATLEDILQHDELFHNYPQLRKTKVRFKQMEPGTRGSYNSESDTITLNSELQFNTERTLIHEIQHAIQKAENFAIGSSPEYWESESAQPQRAEVVERIQGEIDQLREMLASEEESADFIMADIEQLEQTLRNISYHLYQNTAGEIEARDVAERRILTAEQRRSRMPNTGDENTVFAEDDGGYAMSKSEQDSVKEQLREYQDRLNTMKAVATISDNGWRGMNTGAFRQKIVNDLKKTGYRVDNPDIGVIEFDEKLLNRSLNYIQTDAEAAAYQAIPQVLKRGIPLSGHEDHKGRGYETVTIAAPVELNGKRGNMAVVVMKTKGNRYKVHRILTPEGKAFELPEMANAEPTTAGGITEAAKATGAVTPTIDSASTDSITGNGLPVKEQFSISEPVEQTKTLLAVHNKDWNFIRDAVLNWGGIPSPSIAIVEAQQGHTEYGDTSVIFPRSTIDPQADSRNKVYGSDAWTPTHSNAQVEYEVDADTKREFERNIEILAKNVAGGIFAQSSVLDMAGVDDSTTMSLQELAHKLATRYDSVRAAYLADKGGDVDIAYRTKEFDSFGNKALKSYIDKLGEQEVARLAAKMLTGERLSEAEIETAKDSIMDSWIAAHEYALQRKPELRETRIAKQRDKLSDLRTEDFIRNAWDFYEDSGATTDEVNRMETAENLRRAVNDKDVEAWTLDMLQGVLGAPGIYNGQEIFDAKGNRRSFGETHWEYTAENIVRAMNNAASRGEGMWGISGQGLVATATPEYGSVEEIHADEGRLRRVERDEYDRMMRDLDIELERVTDDIMRTTEHHSDNTFEEEQIIGSIIAQAAQGARTVPAVKQTFRKEGYKISDGHARIILKLLEHAGSVPSSYFEAKPQRVVGFEEALAVIAPNYVPVEELEAVRNAGVNVIEYGTEQERMDIANGLEGAKFSISERTGDDKRKIISDLRGMLNGGASAAQLRRYVDTLDDGYTEPENGTSAAEEIVRTAHNEGMSVDEYLRRNWESYEYDGALNEDARRALELEKRQSRRRYSFSEVDEEAGAGYDNTLRNDARVAWGNEGETFTEGNEGVVFTYAIIPAELLITSNDGTGAVNSSYPAELQPRDRTRQSSQLQIQNMARNLNPAKLAESATAQNGAPIIRGDGVVVGGNGRGQAVLQAYDNGTADGYRRYLEENAGRFGIERELLPDNPVLVRVAENAGNWTELARKLNESSTQTYSATEQAMTDAERMGDILDMLQFDEENRGLNTAENKDFIGAFISRVAAESERNSLLTSTGMLSQTGLERVQNAVFAKAYGSAELSARLSESLDNDMKNVTNALMATAARAVQLREGIRNGSLFELDVVEDITQAVELYAKVKAQGRTIDQWQQQMQLFDNYSPEAQSIAKFLEKNKGSSKKMREMLNAVYAEIEELGDPRQATLFGGGNENVTKDDILERAARRYEEITGREHGFSAELGGGNLYEPGAAAGDAGGLTQDGGRGQGHQEDVASVPSDGAVHPGAGGAAAGTRAVTAAEDVRQAENDRLRNITTDDFLEELTRQTQPAETKTSREDVERMRQKDLDDYWESVRQMADVLEPKTDPEEKVSTKASKKERTARQAAQETYSYFKRKMVDSGEAVARIGKAVDDKSLYHFYNMARASSNAATSMIMDGRTDIYGRPTGKSLNEVLGAARSKGDDYYKKFQLYLFHMHNVDRMNRFSQESVDAAQAALEYFRMTNPEIVKFADYQLERMAYDETSPYYFEASEYIELRDALRKAENTRNKPVFGFDVTAEDSKAVADTLLRENPEFKQLAVEVYAYIDNLLRYRVDSGLITEEDYRLLKGMYPHYVPTFRVFDREGTDTRQRNKVQIGSTIKTATGSSEKLMPLHKALAQQTMSVVREGSKNRFGQRLLNSKADRKAMEHVHKVTEYQSDFSESTFDQPEDEVFKKKNTFVVREDGKLWEMEVSPALYEAVQALSPEAAENNLMVQVIRKGNNLFKALVTGYNPTFMVRNFLRDIQDAGLYSKDLSEFAKQYPQAWKEIVSNGRYWQQYKALGGTYSTMFDYETGEVEKGSKLKEKTLGRVEAVNMAVEQAPRLAEFMATVKAAEKAHGTATMEDLMEGMYNAADITVNFGRSGTMGKVLNANFVPFLNPGIQGFSKMIRNVTETKGAKNWARLAVKAAALGIAPALLNALLFGDEEDWDDLKDRDKDVYYLFKIGDSVWLKLPKGRTLSLLGMAADRAIDLAKGEKVDWAGFIDTAFSQSAPANPMENNIMQAWFDTKLFDPDNPGETWYGTDIENQRLQGYAPGERYDEGTDIISKWLGKTFNLSPVKINYLLDQYTGVVGDFLLPLLTPTAERDMFSAAFTVDSTYSNRFSNDFYEMMDELQYQKNGAAATGADNAIYRFWNKKSTEVSEINKVIREIESDETLSDADKKELTAVQYAIRNGIMEDALGIYEAYAASVERHYSESGIEDEEDRTDYAYREANREILGAEYALKAYNKDVYATAQQMQRESGIDYEEFYDFYFAMKEIDETGYRASNAERDLIRQQNMTDEQKIALYTKYVSDSRGDDIAAFRSAGIDFDTYLQAHNVYAEISDADGKAAQKRTEFARWVYEQDLTPEQEGIVKDSFTFFSHIPADEGRYEDFVGLGVDEAAAYDIATEISLLEPLEGKTSVSSTQKWRVVVDADLTPAEQLTALEAVTSESEYRKFNVAYDMGVMPEVFVSVREILPRYDADGNGSYKNAEIEAALDSFGTGSGGIELPMAGSVSTTLTNAQRAALWQLLTCSTSAKNNPYSTTIGWEVINAVNAAKESSGIDLSTGGTESASGGIELPAIGNITGGIELPMA